jgi:hypothetical protein
MPGLLLIGSAPLLSHLFRDPCPEPESSRGNTGHETVMDMNVKCWPHLDFDALSAWAPRPCSTLLQDTS